MPKSLRIVFGLGILALIVGGPLWYRSYLNKNHRNFRVVEEGVLYRSGQLSLDGLKRAIHDYGIKTVVSLRDGDAENDQAEERYLNKHTHVNFARIPASAPWWASDGSVPAEKGLADFRALMANPKNYPVLVHCFAGIHRTGAYCAIYRMDFNKWTSSQAIQEMRNLGYTIIDDHFDVKGYLEKYRPAKNVPQFRTVSRRSQD